MHSMCCVFWGSCPWQVGGSVKNVIAIAAGMCEGLGLGTNAMAALVTRGCAEMRRLVVSLGGEVRVATACDVRAGAYNAVVIRFVSRQRYSGSLAWATLSAHALVHCHGTGWLVSGWGRGSLWRRSSIPWLKSRKE
mmetsp:Transcript_5882/g.12926  ORF Transcript_5882/g.12926 Transcript_5882/m.12926 type:complete len:136 (+) Transcript_5882:798-1205(+)